MLKYSKISRLYLWSDELYLHFKTWFMWFLVAITLDLFESVSLHMPCHNTQNPEIRELRYLVILSMKEEELWLKKTLVQVKD